ncbi:Retrovirus-related Pol polyprotein from transposon RE2 [Sesamum angolense]|uniref:Retrovirus-related Pol polyprotein from transposon RE2 n=1 Tax=Sesamum angolense TaxID=2727404 RepID=A0AAE1TBL9_9LAMI|nr:Retrovirus-related Pol polyprotein from transposon RE2 [Sesamum angolense]
MTTEGENRQNMATANTSERREPEFLQLHGGDHPGMVLVSAPFDGTDFLAWKRSVVIALRAKMKLGFIDGRYVIPDRASDAYETWIRVDSMVTSWILNAMTKRISKAFLYTKSSRQLWLDLEERYGENNGPLVYQLRRAIASVTQGTSTVVDYFNNLIALWDELECLMPTKTCTCGLCTCGFTKITAEEDNLTKLVQFLMGLDDSFDGIRNQILVMDPFPSINKAYSMVLRVERQRMVNMQNNDNSEGVALHTKWTNNRGVNGQRNGHKGKGLIDKRSLTCSNCGKTGHSRETCFKLHGVPDWYRDLKDQKRKEGTQTRGFNVMARDGAENVTEFGEAMKQVTEFLKLMKGQLPATTTDPLQINFAQGEPDSTVAVPCLPNPVPDYLPSSSPTILPPTQSTDLTPSPPASPSPVPTLRSSAHMLFLAQVNAVQEPKSFLEATKHAHWREAMGKEIEALERNDTWDLTELPKGKRAIGSRWVYKVKLNQDGSVDRFKARLVAKGYTQIEGVDYFDSFSPVAKTVTVRLFIAIATAYSWPILQLDVNNAFLHGQLDEEVYMTPPEGYEKAHPGMVCKLKKSLYGLKQASRQWNIELTSKLEAYGFKQSPHDHCLFTMRSDSCFLALIVYVDDVLLTGSSIDDLVAVKTYLDDLFTIKDLGHAKYFLGLELTRSSHGTYVTQHKYLQDIVHDCHLQDAKAAATPSPGLKLDTDSGALLESPDRYRRLIGRLLYLGFSRPDISFAVQQLSQYIQHPRQPHWDAALYLVRYLKGLLVLVFSFPLVLHFSFLHIPIQTGPCVDSRRSLTGYCIFLGDSLVSWKKKTAYGFSFLPKLSIAAWALPFVNCSGLAIFCTSLVSL